MDPDQLHRLLTGLFAAAGPTPEVRAAAERAAGAATDWPGVAAALSDLRLLTRYQTGKLRAGRIDDLLFGPYLLFEKIGEGGMGKVYRAVPVAGGETVALKVVRPHLAANAVVQKRYAREARAAASFDHPNIIRLLAEDTVDGRYYLAMEFIDGADLSRLVREAGKPPERGLPDHQEACEYVRQAALGLQHAHDRGFVHRDVKPSNLLAYGDRPLPGTSGSGGLKLLDMGLVRRLLGDDADGRSDLTRDGTVVGTPDYMSPEQAKNSSAVDGRADLYSLGCTLYFLIHGRPPFEADSPIEKLLKHHTEPPPDPRAGRPDVPYGLGQVVLKLMAKNPADRYQSGAAVADALRPYCPGGAGEPGFSLAPVEQFPFAPAAAPAAAPVAPATAPLRRLVVREPARVPAAVPARPDPTPSGGLPTAPARRPADRTPSDPQPARPASPRTPQATARLSGDATPSGPRTVRKSHKPARKKKEAVWPFFAVGGGAILLLVLVGVILARSAPAPKPAPDPVKPEQRDPPAPTPRADGPAVADGAAAAAVLRPPTLLPKLPTDGNGRLARLLRGLAARRFDANKLDRLTVSLVGGRAVAAGDPAGVVGTDPALTSALLARRQAARPTAGLSADLLAALKSLGTAPAGFAADGGFVLPTGDTLADHRLSWAAATARFDGDDVVLAVTLAGPDRQTLLDFVSLLLVTKLPASVPAVKPLADRLAVADPSARRTDAGLEMTFPLRLSLAELAELLEKLLPE